MQQSKSRQGRIIHQSDRLILLTLVVLTIATRVPFRSEYLFEGDSVNFALAMEEYDVSQYRPHPPGYILFIGLAKLIHPLLQDANQALIATAILFSILAVVFLYLLGKEMFSREVGAAASFLFLFLPFFWFHGDVALSYTGGACFAIVIAFFSNRIFTEEKKTRWMYFASIALGLSGGIRQDILLFLSPLVAFSMYRNWQGWGVCGRAILLALVSFAAWYVPMVAMSQGYAAYSRTLSEQFDYYATEYSILFGNTLLQHFKMVKDFVLVFLGATFLALIYVSIFVVVERHRIPRLVRNDRFIFLLLWIVPSVLFLVVVFFQQPGYVLTPMPAVYIAFAYAMVALTKRFAASASMKRVLVAQVVVISLIHSYNYLGPTPFKVGGVAGKPFEEKTWSEAAVTMVFKAFFRHTDNTVHQSCNTTQVFTRAIQDLGYTPDEVAVLVFHRSPWSYSLAMYYLPEYPIYYIQDYKPIPDRVKYGKGRRNVEDLPDRVIRLDPSTRCVVAICEDGGPTHHLLTQTQTMRKVSLDHGLYMFLIDQGAIRFKNLLFTKSS